MNESISSINCQIPGDEYKGFCVVEQLYWDDEDEPPFTIWNCDHLSNGPDCEAFANGKCIYMNLTSTYTDCSGAIFKDKPFTEVLKCCDPSIDGPNCNHETIDINSCERNAEYEEAMQSYHGCPTAAESTLREYYCNDNVTEISCDPIQAIYEEQAFCECKLFSVYYSKIGSNSKTALQAEMDGFMSTLSVWNDVLGCDIYISCDLSTGTIATGLPTQSPVIPNECEPVCDDTEVCLSNGECQRKITDTSCTSTSECIAIDGNNFVCMTVSDGGFCYYDECVAPGTCDDGYKCTVSVNIKGNIEYESGVCQKIGSESSDTSNNDSASNTGYIFAIVIIVILFALFCCICGYLYYRERRKNIEVSFTNEKDDEDMLEENVLQAEEGSDDEITYQVVETH